MRKFAVSLLWLAVAVGCDEEKDDKYVDLAREADDRQASQNQRIADQSRELAQTVRHVAVAEAESRKEITAVQREIAERLHDDSTALHQQRETFEERLNDAESQDDRRITWGGVLTFAAELLICSLPILLGIYALRLANRPTENAEVTEVFLAEIIVGASSPLLGLSSPKAIAISGESKSSDVRPPTT